MKASLSLIIATVLALTIAIAPNEAVAQDSELRAKAKKLVTEGREHQKNKRWDEAAAKYRAAYDLVPHPTLLFNLGQVRRLGGEKATALQFYRKFVAVSSSGDLAIDARRYIKELESELGKLPFEDPLKPKSEPDPVDEKPATEPVETDPAPPPVAGRVDSGPSDGGSATLRIAGLASAGVGALLVGGGVYFGLRAKSLSDELSETNMEAWTDDDLQKDEDGRAAERNMFILSIAGGATIATGAVLYLLGRGGGEGKTTSASIVPSSAGGMSVVLSGSF